MSLNKLLVDTALIGTGTTIMAITLYNFLDKYITNRALLSAINEKKYELKEKYQETDFFPNAHGYSPLLNSIKFSNEVDLYTKNISRIYNYEESMVREYLLKDLWN